MDCSVVCRNLLTVYVIQTYKYTESGAGIPADQHHFFRVEDPSAHAGRPVNDDHQKGALLQISVIHLESKTTETIIHLVINTVERSLDYHKSNIS